jgi:hypothetical protein
MTSAILGRGMPTTMAINREMPIRARNACTLSFEIKSIIKTIAMIRVIIRPIPDIINPTFPITYVIIIYNS